MQLSNALTPHTLCSALYAAVFCHFMLSCKPIINFVRLTKFWALSLSV